MKRLFGIIAVLMLVAFPVGLYAQVEAGAGSIKLGVHIDSAYRYSAEDDEEDVYWPGYSTFNAEAAILSLSGKVGDKVMWRLCEAFAIPLTVNGIVMPNTSATLLEAVVEWKVIDQLGIVVGRELIPTNLANAPHVSKLHHVSTLPLMLTGGFNANRLAPFVSLPTYQTGAGLDLNFSGVSLTYNYYDGQLQGPLAVPGGNDLGSDYQDKEKGGNVSLGYNGEVGPGKLAARGFYFQETSDLMGMDEPDSGEVSGWGLGVIYDADKFFGGIEYNSITWEPQELLLDESNTQWGMYGVVGVKFSGVEGVVRYDLVDYTDLEDTEDLGDTESDVIIGLNYWINDNAMIGINYALKMPEEPEDVDYPNIDELSFNVELNLL